MIDVLDEIILQNLEVYRHAPPRLQEDVSQEAQVADDYRGRLVYELLQNADDAMAEQSGSGDTVTFIVTDKELWVANTGRPLDELDVQGLCGLGASSKAGASGKRRASIGHKGLGFKSVLEITAAPEAFSTTIAFRLGRDHARPLIEAQCEQLGRSVPRHVPAMRFPERVTAMPEAWTTLEANGFRTAFRFPFADHLTSAQRVGLADSLLELPITTVLFLKHLEEVRVEVHQRGRELSRTWLVERHQWDDADWRDSAGLQTSGLYRIDIATDDGEDGSFLVALDVDVEIAGNRSGLSGPAWDGVELTEVSVAVADDGPSQEIPTEWRRFHVFLPTQEPSTYPMLVNGAFSTDLSRQRVRVSDDADDYNSHLIRRAATLFRDVLLPRLMTDGVARVLETLDRQGQQAGPAATLLHDELTRVLREIPLLPTESLDLISLQDTVLPPVVLGPEGSDFREVLPQDASWNGRMFPTAEICAGELATIAADHGARAVEPADALAVLAETADVERSRLVNEPQGRFKLDPVLELCTALWERCGATDRQELEATATTLALFPVLERVDGQVHRIALEEQTAFYPPRAARHDLPLRGLQFMCHSVCWGSLLRRERLAVLDDRMKAWTSLFDIKEFRFEEVMRASVLPGLVRNPTDEALALREGNQDLDAIAAICQLAGAVTKADKPLRLNRLGGDRAMFNLGRLPVPCRSDSTDERWEPAYSVYFGSDWLGKGSVEPLVEAARSAGAEIDIAFLAPPDMFLGRLSELGESLESLGPEESEPHEDEVGLDDDTDEALETNERDRWLAFLSWIGVNPCLRLVHFHDVDDESTGWTKTKGLDQPSGWAFRQLGPVWTDFRAALAARLSSHPRRSETDPYLYIAHDLDQIVPLLRAAAEDESAAIAAEFFAHLVRHWSTYGQYTTSSVALVDKGKWPGSRKDPPRASVDELLDVGDDLWLHRLRQWPVCPTAQGPRPSATTWRPSDEIDRRFGRRGRSSDDFLPTLRVPPDLPSQQVRACSDALGVRGELSPSTFTVDDAEALCNRLPDVFPGDITAAQLRSIVRPIYRQVFELLSGRSDDDRLVGHLEKVPLLAQTSDGFRFLPAHEIVYASVPGTRERSGIGFRVPLFVLEAEPAATSPLASLFSVQVLEDVLEWSPEPGEAALGEVDIQAFHEGLNSLVAPLLARISAGRPEARERDRRILLQFVDSVELVDSLKLRCAIEAHDLGELPSRSYFVKRTKRSAALQAFVVWNGQPWPPVTEDAAALAMALADVLEVNMVETFLAFIQADDARRRQLLELAGAASYLTEVSDELATAADEETDDKVGPPTPGALPSGADDEKPASGPAAPVPAAPLIPLRRFDELLIDGEPVLVTGQTPDSSSAAGTRGSGASARAGGGGTRTAAGTDLSALDALGMSIALTYERRRIERLDRQTTVLPSLDGPTDVTSMVVDVHSPALIQAAEEQSVVVKLVLDGLEKIGVSRLYPGFDILSIVDGDVDRLIELKSSGVDAQVQAMSWNEWKTARASELRDHFWLYLAGNLRADLADTVPFIRAIRDPFGTLFGKPTEDMAVRRAVQLRVREFGVAEELRLGVRSTEDSAS